MHTQAVKTEERKSRAIAHAIAQQKSDAKQRSGFVDNRPKGPQIQSQKADGSGTVSQLKVNHQISLVDIKGYTLSKYASFIKQQIERATTALNGRKNKLWDSKNENYNPGHTLGTMVDLDGKLYNGYSTYANNTQYEENVKIKGNSKEGTWNLETRCAEQGIIKENGADNRYIFSIAKDSYGIKPACSKCASGAVLGAHNIIDIASKDPLADFGRVYKMKDLFALQDHYLKAYFKGKPDKDFIKRYVAERTTLEKPEVDNQWALMGTPYQKEQDKLYKEAEQKYNEALDAWKKKKKPSRATYTKE